MPTTTKSIPAPTETSIWDNIPENTFTDGAHRFWYRGEPVAQVAGCRITSRYVVWFRVWHPHGAQFEFDHYPTVVELAHIAAQRADCIRPEKVTLCALR